MLRNVNSSNVNNSSMFASNAANISANVGCKTPREKSSLYAEPRCAAKTPGSAGRKTPGWNRSLTPSRNLAITNNPSACGGGGGDRFIPNRSATQFDLAHYLIVNSSQQNDSQCNTSVSAPTSASKLEHQRLISKSLNGSAMNVSGTQRIFAFQGKKLAARQMSAGVNDRVVFQTCASSSKKATRNIPSQPERILDAPDVVDDYYLNLLDWSSSSPPNLLAVALAGSLYLWHGESGAIQELFNLAEDADARRQQAYISSVSWVKEGQTSSLAVGLSSGEVELWDIARSKRLRQLNGHSDRVGALSWNNRVVSSGARDGRIFHHDVRQRDHLISRLRGHTDEVCGLRWSPDGRYLASGGSDHLLNVWPVSPVAPQDRLAFTTEATPLYTFTEHRAAVKALAWCPTQSSILASGGGTDDGHIRFWNINTGACTEDVDTASQVSSIMWSTNHKELISAHGPPDNQLSIWTYPKVQKIANLQGHTSRVLGLAMSPDGEFVVSAAADESLRVWKCFARDAANEQRRKQEHSSTSLLNGSAQQMASKMRGELR